MQGKSRLPIISSNPYRSSTADTRPVEWHWLLINKTADGRDVATFQLVLLLSCAVLISSLADQIVPKISLPLLQIALGVIIALLSVSPKSVSLNPDFFLLLFIAPLLFYESKEADKLGLWRNRTVILSLSIGLVIAIVFAVGLSVHALIPSIPLAAAFALGAALGPTDAVAVSSLSDTSQLGKTEKSRLNGEALLNDASGVVAFRFAIAAAATGSFSAFNASVSFLVSFFGGILLGLMLGLAAYLITKFTIRNDLGSNVFHVLFDVTLPFIIFLTAEVMNVSGILAVVTAGLIISTVNDRRVGPAQSSLNIVSDNVWKVISFALNGIVFVLLGMQLPRAMRDSWDDVAIGNTQLIGYVIAITILIVVVRFVWLVLMDALLTDPATGKKPVHEKGFWRSALVSTIGGAKGAVTLSVIFSIPFHTAIGTPFPQRDLIIFLASGVILLTLVMANFLLPILAPLPKRPSADIEQELRAKVAVLRNVIDRLNLERTIENSTAVDAVVKSYNRRVESILKRTEDGYETSIPLRLDVLEHQRRYIVDLMESGEVDEEAAFGYLRRVSDTIGYMKHHGKSRWWLRFALHHRHASQNMLKRSLARMTGQAKEKASDSTSIDIAIASEREAIELLNRYVESPRSPYPAEVVSRVLLDSQRTLRLLESRHPSVTAFTRTTYVMEGIQRRAYKFELEEIHAALQRDDIKRSTAASMRDNVYMMLVDLDADIA